MVSPDPQFFTTCPGPTEYHRDVKRRTPSPIPASLALFSLLLLVSTSSAQISSTSNSSSSAHSSSVAPPTGSVAPPTGAIAPPTGAFVHNGPAPSSSTVTFSTNLSHSPSSHGDGRA